MKDLDVRIEGVEGQVHYDGDILHFIPIRELSYATEYTVIVKGTDIAGNHLPPSSWKFRTTGMGQISGRFVNEEGEPLPGVSIEIDSEFFGVTENNGSFRISLEQGKYWLNGSHPDLRNISMRIDVLAGSVNGLGDIELKSFPEDGGISLITIVIIVVMSILMIGTGLVLTTLVVIKRRIPSNLANNIPIREYLHLRREISKDIDMKHTNCYSILELRPSATEYDIRRGYRKLAARHHPDRYTLESVEYRAKATDEMVTINNAREILLDPAKRAIHDMMMKERGG
jgi:DnaJ-domain-containing protein 1